MRTVFLLMMICIFMVTGCGSNQQADSSKLKVMASFYPMAEFVKQVGGSLTNVEVMITDGIEPHDWEPTARDLSRLGASKLFVYNGGVESWAEAALNAVKEQNIKVVKAGDGLFYTEGSMKMDPHVWLSPRRAAKEVEHIAEALCEIDPKNALIYKENADKYKKQLLELDARLLKVAMNAPQKVFITTHAAFAYLAQDYGLQQVAIMGLSPEAEPTPADLRNLVNLIGDKQVKYVFFETLVSPRVAQTVAEAAGVKTLVLDPLEGLSKEGRDRGDNYFTIMSRNIDNLEKALYNS